MTVLRVAQGEVTLGLSASPQAPSGRDRCGPACDNRLAAESPSVTLAVTGNLSGGGVADFTGTSGCTTSCAADDGRDAWITLRGRAPCYYLSQPGRGPMLVVRCGENQRIRINDAFDLVVLDIHDRRSVRGLPSPSPIHYTARRLAERLRQAQGFPLPQVSATVGSQPAFSL